MIVINGRFLTQSITGVQRFAIEISKLLPKKIGASPIVYLIPNNSEIDCEKYKDFNIIKFGNHKGNLWEQLDLVSFLKKNNNPLLINFGGIAPIMYSNKIMFIHDLSFKHNPEYYSLFFQWSYNFLLPRSAKRSKKILTVSNYVKKDIENTFNIKNIEVIYPAIDSIFKNLNVKREKLILALSAINPRKNISRVIEAFKLLNSDYKLVFIGSKSKTFANIDIDTKGFEDRIIFTGYLNDIEIVNYYNKASIFTYASTFEGFGIPPLEAQACGCPCLISDVTSLPEVYSNSALYCNPYDINDIKQKLETLISNSDLRDRLVAEGFKNINKYNWEKSSEKLVQIIKTFLD